MSRPRPEHINLNDVSPESGGGATKAIRRAFFADWVIECGGSRETQNLLSTLGQPLTVIPHPPESSGPAKNATPGRMSRSESMGDLLVEPSTYRPQKLTPTINELLATERNYVHRLRTLKRVYADPLRIFAKDPIACIIPLFVANTLFANIDALVLVNEAFLDDLERAVAGTGELGIGDVAVKHFVQTKKFDCYRTYYDKCEDAQAMFEDQLAKQKVFREFLSASKQKTEGLGGSGLRELLMEPVQRIPRYTLLWKDMIAYMDPLDPQREQLETAIKAARAIAACEKEESTKRMIVMTGIQQNMEGFPAELINNNRDYYDSLDAEDYITDVSVLSPTSSTFPSSSSIPGGTHSSSFSSAGIPSLHCTLILFSDRLLISKRPTGGTSGRRLTGLEDVAKMCKGRIIGGGSAGGGGVRVYGGPGSEKAKDRDAGKLSYKGMVNVLDVIATDVGGGDFQLYLSRPPNDQSERWSGRHFRCYSVVHPPQPITLDPAMSRESKQRFVHNLWAAQALVRARGGRSTAWAAVDEERLEGWGGKLGGRAKGFWNEWDRQSWEEDTSKAKVIVHVDELGGAKPISIGDETRPYLVVRVQPLAGSLSRVSVHTRDNDETAEIIPTNSVTSKVVQTIHQYGVFQHRTESRSCPTTPVHAPHSKRPMLNVGLDAISRNLFGSGSLSGRGGGEGGFSIGSMSHKRTRSAISKSSISEGSVTRSTISSMGRSAGDEGSRSRTNSSVGRKTPELIGGRKTPEPFASAADSTTSPRHLSARKPVPKPEVSAPGKPEHLDQLMDQQSVRARSRSSPEVPTMESVTAAARIASRPSSRPTSPLQVVNKTPVLEKTAMFSSQPRSDPMALDSPTTTSRTRRRSQDSPAPIGGRRRTPVGLRSSSNETGGPISSTSETRRPAGPRSRPTSPSMASAPTATSTVPFALSLPTPVAAPSPFLVDLSSPAPTDRRAAQQAALGLGSAHTKTRVFSTESSRSRRTSDDWRRRRPSGPLDPSSPVSSPDEPDSPSSTASGRRRRRGQSMEGPSPVLGKKPKREKEDVPPFPLPPSPLPLAGAAPRSPLHALGDVSNGGELPPPVVGSGTDFRKGSSPSRPSGLRKESRSYSSTTLLGSGGGGNKRLATNEKDLEAMTVEERAVARLGLIVNDASVARKGLKRMRLEIDGLRAHINKESAQKSRLDRLTEINTGSLPRSPTSRNITRRAAPGQIGRVEEARLLLEMGAHESNNSSPTKLNGATSISRRPIVDVAFLSTCFETLDGVLGSVSTDVQSLATHVDLLKPDVTTLASSLPPAPAPSMGTLNLQRELEEANALLAQARKISQDRAAELADAKRENATLYEAFNEELEQMYADMTLPGAEAHVAIKRDLATTKADRNKFKLEHMSLSGKVKALEEERERMRADRTRMEALLQSHGLF